MTTVINRAPTVSPEDEELVNALVPLLMGMSPSTWSSVRRAVDEAFGEEEAKVTLSDEARMTLLLKAHLR